MASEARLSLSHKADSKEESDGSSSYGGEVAEVTTEEQALARRLERRILPIACMMYLFTCKCCNRSSQEKVLTLTLVLDRSNLGNARLQGLPRSTLGKDPTGVLFDCVTSTFYFSYVGSISSEILV